MVIMDKERLFQTVILIAVVLCFDFMERRRPGRAVDRQWEMHVNILALAVVIAVGEIWKDFLMKGYAALDLVRLFSASGLQRLPGAAKIILGTVLADFSLYWVHRGMHGKGLLWRTHVFHHSIEHLWWLSGSRTSVTHLFLFAVPQVLIVSVLLQLSPWEAGVAFSIGIVVNIWIHTNIWVNLGPLEWLFITPNYHRVHHGSRDLVRRNLGFIFTIWDRMFGTYTDPNSIKKDFNLGFVPTRNRLLRMIIGY
jgi:sterol desaturase/sphingolipid hydroxylase (fatty acid hydroxylase superfamily)